MIYLLFDTPRDENKTSFIKKLLDIDIKEVYSPKSNKLIVGWIKGCLTILQSSHKNDTIVCWYDFQAILLWWFCKLAFMERRIVCVNVLLKDKDTLKNKMVAYLYKKVLNSNSVVASVTSREYGEHIKRRLNIKRDFFLLHDVFHNCYTKTEHMAIKPNTVFCGGRNGRDWNFIINVARNTPEIKYQFVMPKSIYYGVTNSLPNNVFAKCDLSIDDFINEMCSCEIVALPLDTEAPAGLIVMFQAVANRKYVITTDTMTTREYLADGRGCLLPNDAIIWANKIKECINKKNILIGGDGKKILSFLQEECSEEKFVEGIKIMTDMIKL